MLYDEPIEIRDTDRKFTCSICNGLIGVDRLVQFTSVEEILQQLLDFWNTSGSSDENDVVDSGLVHLGIAERLLNWVECTTEKIGIQFFESGPRDARVEVDTFVERIDFNARLAGTGECALGSFAGRSQTPNCSLVVWDVFLVFSFEFLNEVGDHTIVEVLSSKMGVSGCRLHLENSIFNGQDRHIEGTTTEIENQNVSLSSDFLVETVGDGSGCGFVDDSQDVETGDGSCILRGLSLGIVEVSWDCDNCVSDSLKF